MRLRMEQLACFGSIDSEAIGSIKAGAGADRSHVHGWVGSIEEEKWRPLLARSQRAAGQPIGAAAHQLDVCSYGVSSVLTGQRNCVGQYQRQGAVVTEVPPH